MRAIVMSDTHHQHSLIHHLVKDEKVDILIHAGDGSNQKSPYLNEDELRNCLEWISSFKHIKYKIFVPGNHDTSFAKGLIKRSDYPNIIFLVDQHVVIQKKRLFKKKEVVKIFGSPYTPTYGEGWAYNVSRAKSHKHWDLIHNNTDIVITHGPPKYILDSTQDYEHNMVNVGDKSLYNKMIELEPRYHIFGHLHDESHALNHGIRILGDKCKTSFINASICNIKGDPVNKPIIIEI